jgi:bifunctional UDP-N-acetylglucosamine pyrophosphorylase / glucosamine-1-phosphate N-acetyltransferase
MAPRAGRSLLIGLLLAADSRSRMNSRHPVTTHRLLGRPIGRFALDLLQAAGTDPLLVLAPPDQAGIPAALGDDWTYLPSPAALGSRLAELATEPVVVLVVQGNVPLFTIENLQRLVDALAEADAAVLTGWVEDEGEGVPVATGDDGVVERVLEEYGEGEVEVLSGVAAVRSDVLTEICSLAGAHADAGWDVAALVRLLLGRGHCVLAVEDEDPELGVAIYDRVDLAVAGAMLRDRTLVEHMLAGVTIEDPQTVYIEPGVTIGQDTIVRPMTFLSGNTQIGDGCEIGPSVRITDCRVGNGASIQFAVLADSEVGPEARIGPFSQVRPGCRIGAKVKVGNFVELKNAEVEAGASMGHLAYIGDAFVGEKSNIGAGTITCNYDGKKKHRTRLGRRSFIGSNSTLVAPVEVQEGAYVAAGSVVTEDVPADALAIGRARQANKLEWARRRREAQGE